MRLSCAGIGLRGNKFQFELHPHPRGKALERAKRRICGSAFELADVCLVNARDIRQLILRQIVFFAPFNEMARTTVPPAPGHPTALRTPAPVSFSASRRSDLASCQGAPFIVSFLLRVPPVLPAARQMPGTGFRHMRKQSPASHARPAASLPPPPE